MPSMNLFLNSAEAAKSCVALVPNYYAAVEVGSLSKKEKQNLKVEISTSTNHLNYREAIL